uniref:ABC transporter domain-containing protein n=1 Tax=Strigamia maritima TaxID=126957 RepID=T1J7I7_STRMM
MSKHYEKVEFRRQDAIELKVEDAIELKVEDAIELEVEYAIEVKNVRKSYNDVLGRNKTEILSGINLIIKKGGIYGLLGPSGCGKTTLLKLLTGRLQPDSGSIKCFGNTVGSEECGIPGDKVGYMPQETALFGEFTIKETMIYFGHIFNMTSSEVQLRTQFLLDLLQLSNESALIKHLRQT